MPSSFDILYSAATEALVSESSANSTFEKIVQQGYVIGEYGGLKKDLEETEVHIKKDFNLKTMPGPWRSAKSVVLTSMSMGIKLTDNNGVFFGKSALQAMIKAGKEKKTMTEEEYLGKVYAMIRNVPPSFDKIVIKTALQMYIEGI